ncbi:LPS export ABC transporter permease LptF [Phenylobacterium montanum]|uniref:LPS export ABC transporter permease LptF n=1 Tax=Phenylobacterium montanum TaxID=2823693 RepID=A0A975G0R8_9CAUL|nr:LPS export ABC transporter permease LptF [Caulobacter sp. S6]QUD88993.1 LPS export ABC transporter permease LptF [Caulobacter sp. S6]
MSLIEKYLLRQLLGPSLLAIAALGAVVVLSQTLGALDIIVNQGQSPWVLIKVIALALPQLMAMVLPIALFIAALVALNRLHTEQEIVVCFASGMSRWRVISPAMRLAAVAAFLALITNLWVAPWADRAMREELFRVRTDLAASLIHVGQFTSPAAGLTVYAQDSDQSGAFHNLFVYQVKPEGGDTTYLAERGRITKRNGQPVLVMRDGSSQSFSTAGVLNYLKFEEYIFDLSPFMANDELIHYKIPDRYLHELLFPDLTQDWERKNRKKMLAEAHARLATPIYNLTFMAMALAAVIGGTFSRMGYGRRILIVCAAAAVLRMLGIGAQAAAAGTPWLNILQYAVPIGGLWWSMAVLFRQRAGRFARRRPTSPRMELAGAEA